MFRRSTPLRDLTKGSANATCISTIGLRATYRSTSCLSAWLPFFIPAKGAGAAGEVRGAEPLGHILEPPRGLKTVGANNEIPDGGVFQEFETRRPRNRFGPFPTCGPSRPCLGSEWPNSIQVLCDRGSAGGTLQDVHPAANCARTAATMRIFLARSLTRRWTCLMSRADEADRQGTSQKVGLLAQVPCKKTDDRRTPSPGRARLRTQTPKSGPTKGTPIRRHPTESYPHSQNLVELGTPAARWNISGNNPGQCPHATACGVENVFSGSVFATPAELSKKWLPNSLLRGALGG